MTIGITKIALSALIMGIGSSAAVGSYLYLTKQSTFEELLNTETPTRRLIEVTDKSKGSAAWEKYKTDNKSKGLNKDNDEWQLTEWPKDNAKKEIPDSLFTKCKNQLKKKAKDNKNSKYKQFLDWCTVVKETS